MKRLLGLILAVMLLSGCSTLGLTSPSNYALKDGTVIETSEEMAIIMATRDGAVDRDVAFATAMSNTTGEGQRIALTAAYFGKSSPQYQRSRTWDERLLPWAQGVFMPIWLSERSGSRSGKNGINIDGVGNTVTYSEDTISGGSSKSVYVNPQARINKQYQLGSGSPSMSGTQPAADPVIVEPFVVTP